MRACRYLKRRLCHRRVQEEEAEEEERELRLRLMRRRFGRRYRDLEGFEVLSPLEYSFFEEQQQRVLFFNFSKKKRKKKKKNFWGQSPKPKGFLNFFPLFENERENTKESDGAIYKAFMPGPLGLGFTYALSKFQLPTDVYKNMNFLIGLDIAYY